MKDTVFYRGSRFAHVRKFKPIKNSTIALFGKHHRLYDRWWYELDRDDFEEREKVARQMNDIYAELRRRNFFEVVQHG